MTLEHIILLATGQLQNLFERNKRRGRLTLAEGETIGVGGWFALSDDFAWFSEIWTVQEVRHAWPFLTKEPQQYIACFETIAQLALAMLAKRRLGISQRFAIPTGSDNVPGLASILLPPPGGYVVTCQCGHIANMTAGGWEIVSGVSRAKRKGRQL